MKLNDNVIAIYNIDLDESINEFKNEFNSISKLNDPTGIHTFTVSSYYNDKVSTDVFFCSVYSKTVLIYASQLSLELNIGVKKPDEDDQISLNYEITGGEVKPTGGSFIEVLASENKSEAYYIGRHINDSTLGDVVSNLINKNMHELVSLVVNTELRNDIINMVNPDIKLIDNKIINNTYYDIYTIPLNSTFKINQIDGIGDTINNSNMVDVVIVASNPDLVYLGDCCNDLGYYYRIYSLNKQDELAEAKRLIEFNLNDTSNLIIDESELVNISVDFFNERMNQFKTDINTAIEKEELPTNIDENPYSNRLFDVERPVHQKEPLTMTRRLGDG